MKRSHRTVKQVNLTLVKVNTKRQHSAMNQVNWTQVNTNRQQSVVKQVIKNHSHSEMNTGEHEVSTKSDTGGIEHNFSTLLDEPGEHESSTKCGETEEFGS